LTHRLLEAAPGSHTFALQELRTDHRHRDQKQERRKYPDRLPDLNYEVELGDRDHDQKDEKKANHPDRLLI
jgi:hypothetical protein